MSKKSIQAQKKKMHELKMQQQEIAKLERNMERLQTLKGGFALNGETRLSIKPDHYIQPKVMYRNYQGFGPVCPDPVHVPKKQQRLSEEMQAREEIAQREIHEKKKLSMPLYNKGGPMFPTSTDLEAMKNGELRRRS